MLRIYDVALGLVREIAGVARDIERKDADLARQLRRAMSSVTLNLAEGSGQRGARRGNHYAMALGSAREALAALRTAAAWGHVPEPGAEVLERFDHLIATLYRVSR